MTYGSVERLRLRAAPSAIARRVGQITLTVKPPTNFLKE
jgi:hypothetical protein